jgi:hypothetical protein
MKARIPENRQLRLLSFGDQLGRNFNFDQGISPALLRPFWTAYVNKGKEEV